MKKIGWNIEKAKLLESNVTRRNLTFERCVIAIQDNRILDIILNPSTNHPHQLMYVLEIDNYAVCVPFIETDDEIFLKTVFPNRKLTAFYLGARSHE
jgi:hypothetical protein